MWKGSKERQEQRLNRFCYLPRRSQGDATTREAGGTRKTGSVKACERHLMQAEKKSSISSPCLKLNRNRVVGPISDLNTQTLRWRVCKVYVYLEKRFTVTNRCPILGLAPRDFKDFPGTAPKATSPPEMVGDQRNPL